MSKILQCRHCGLEDYFHIEAKTALNGKKVRFLVSDHNNAVHDCKHQLTPWIPPIPDKVYCPYCSLYYDVNSVCGHLLDLGYNEKFPPLHPTKWVEEKLHEIKQRGRFTNIEKKEEGVQETLD